MHGIRHVLFKSFVVLGLLIFARASLSAPVLAPWGGGPAPALALKDPEGKTINLLDLRGKVVLVNFWATWCEPCRQEMPSMQRLRDRLVRKPFVVLAVNVDEPEARVRTFLNQSRLDLTVLLDPNKSVTRAWGARVLPVTYIVGPDGRLRYRVLGEMDWDNERAVNLISELIAGG